MTRIEDSKFLVTSAGVETYLAFIQRFPLREFCAFEVLERDDALATLETGMLEPVLDLAAERGFDVLLDVLVWRAQPDYVAALGYGDDGVARLNRLAVERLRGFVARWRARRGDRTDISVFLNGDIGPRGDGYRIEGINSPDAAQRYHQRQIEALAEAGVDAISCLTMTNVNETIGIVRAAREAGLPCIVSPTVETDGRTPEGMEVGEFIEQIERATDGSPLFYMVNCAHPSHLAPSLRRARDRGETWLDRFRGLRANASSKSHAELDESPELDRGEPRTLGTQMAQLQAEFDLRLIGGCCGTDAEHIAHMISSVTRA